MSKSLFVGDLSYTCTKETLIGLFSKYGTVKNAHIVNGRPELSSNPNNCASLGYGFVEMASQDEAETAMMELNQSLFLGRFLRVKCAQKNSSEGSYPLLTKDIINSVHVRFKTVDVSHDPIRQSPCFDFHKFIFHRPKRHLSQRCRFAGYSPTLDQLMMWA